MKIYMNKMQREVLQIGAKDNIIVAGRGTGKGVLHAAINLRNFQGMPGSTTGVIAPNAKRALTNTLPSMFIHWENWGYKRNIHWCVGHPPPKHMGWGKPLYTPDNWDNIISFYTGAVAQIISQDRTGTSNSKSFDFLDIDEAKFIDFERLKDETFQANRGQGKEFGHRYYHHGMLVTSDMPITKKGSWFLHYEAEETKDVIDMICNLIAERDYIQHRLSQPDEQPEYIQEKLKRINKLIDKFRKEALLFRTYSSLTNMEILGESFIRQQKRDLPPLVFLTSIMCRKPEIMRDGFYSNMRPYHKYTAVNHSYTDSLDYDIKKMQVQDCRWDSDVDADRPLRIAFDYNANINWMVVGQPNPKEQTLKVLKSFFVKYDRKLPELCEDFNKYYHYHRTKVVIFYYDSTALGSNYAVNNQDFEWVISHKLKSLGWSVRAVYIGNPMNHMEKHLLINRAFAGQTTLMPRFNEENNEALLLSIQMAGVYNAKKDKRGEKLAETEEDRLETRTDGSDAFDTLFIGCEKFPERDIIIGTTSH